jgi:hypothetical protein
MRAAFLDPKGPPIWRAAPYLPSALVVLAGLFGPWSGGTSVLIVIGGLFSLNAAGLVPIRQRNRRTVELVCGPGHVDVKGGVTRTERIDAKSIVGGSTARTRSGLVLTLAHVRREAPLVLELESEADAERVRQSLGIGHDGFGAIGWRTSATGGSGTPHTSRAIALVSGLVIALAMVSGAVPLIALSAFFGGLVAFFATMIGAAGWFVAPELPTVLMTSDGLRLWTARGWFHLPYGNVLDVVVEKGCIRFVVPPPHHEVVVARSVPWAGDGLTEDEAVALVAQIRTAADRARGHGPRKADVTGRVEVLRRLGDSPRAWFARLDMAGQMLSAGAGYRGHPLEIEDLWLVLEDPDADAELRMAAARVLRSSGQPDAKVRIDTAVAAVRDEGAHAKLRIAVDDDVERASAELAEWDAREHRGHLAARGVRW